eukprot:TRINITY_DN11554_c0_g1_i1.p2 TRINITY_DN11554_c0_g1~~TRINITY_DN11554_c0_g1_i1.p2  ORF type:complete len:208 (+),score=67.00 TRINITY_DN11554_c0_g1_i1:109-732(+)
MATFSADAGRMKLRTRPTIKVGSQYTTDHNIFSTEPPQETPHRMRKAVEPVEHVSPEDLGVLRVGKKHIEEPAVDLESRKVIGSSHYAPEQSDRFKSTRRYHNSGNVLTGEVATDAFEARRPAKTMQTPVTAPVDHIKHAPEEASQTPARCPHENRVKQARSYCPFAVDDGYQPEEQKYRPLHPSNITHGNVLTGGAMSPQFAGRRW